MLLKKLIIAEDDEDTSYLVSTALGDSGFLCIRARNGEEAVNLARTEMPDALVLDVMMPRMDGIEVCKLIKGDVMLSRIPILMLTSLVGIDDRVAGLEAGADDYLPKPFDIRELTARIRALIRASRRERTRNPTTGLPGGEAIEDHAVGLLRQQEPFALLYIDVENFRSFADVNGYRKADSVISYTGRVILQAARRVSEPPPFVGHVGGDDFLVICAPEDAARLQEEIKVDFLAEVEQFYSRQDRDRGCMVLITDGREREVDFMNPSVGEVQAEAGKYSSVEELAGAVTRAKMQVRRRTLSGVFPLPRGS